VLVLFLTLWFCAPGVGVFGALVASAIVAAVGGWVLRQRDRGEIGAP
jgi:hypothetical protein